MFVDSRRRGLELFLHRIATHKELRKSEDFRLFLQGGQEFHDIREGKAKPPQPAKTKGFMDYFNELSQVYIHPSLTSESSMFNDQYSII